MALVMFELGACNECGCYAYNEAFTQVYCDHPENDNTVIVSTINVPDNCPALFNNNLQKVVDYSVNKWKVEKGIA